jgi:hypothetical protein
VAKNIAMETGAAVELDSRLSKAVERFLEAGRGFTSVLQRKLRLVRRRMGRLGATGLGLPEERSGFRDATAWSNCGTRDCLASVSVCSRLGGVPPSWA